MFETKNVITTNGKRYALVIQGNGMIEVRAEVPRAPAYDVVCTVTELFEAVRSHSGGDVKDLY